MKPYDKQEAYSAGSLTGWLSRATAASRIGFFCVRTEAVPVALVYRIVDWDKHFENNRTRELKTLLWIALPAKLDGDGYTEMVEGKDGASIYGAWVACVIVASRCDPRGTLLRDGARPHNSESLARITRLPKQAFDAMLERAQTVGWIETYDDLAPSCEILAGSCLTGREEGSTGITGNNKTAVAASCDLTSLSPETQHAVTAWLEYKAERRESYKPQGLKAFLAQITKAEKAHGSAAVAEAIELAMSSGWKGWQHGLGEKNGAFKTAAQRRTEANQKAYKEFLDDGK